MTVRVRSLLAVAALAIMTAACSDNSTAPLVESPVFSQLGAESAAAMDRHLVLFKGAGVPKDFARTVEALGGTVVYSHRAGIAAVTGLTEAAAATLARDRAVAAVERDAAFDLEPMLPSPPIAADTPQSPASPSTAVLFALQWNMRAIQADAAWAAGRVGSPGVTVAILDSGIDYLYPDLAGRVDLSRSASFVALDDGLVSSLFPSRHPVTDLNWHGTHVAATAVSNAFIVAGVTSGATLIGVKVCNVFGSCPLSSLVGGVLHAVDAGADVANMSLGGVFAKAGNGRLVGFINRVFTYANSRGMTIVVAIGNDGTDLDRDRNAFETYCSAPNVICVSATGPTFAASPVGPWTNIDAPADYTSFGGSAVSVAAPGGNGASSAGWVLGPCSQTSLIIPDCQAALSVLSAAGTSMAAPHVSGLAALVVEDLGRNPGQIRARIQQTADDLGQPGTDPYYGKGRINVPAALR